MGELRINLTNFLTVGLLAFLFVFVANHALKLAGKAGLPTGE